MADRYRGGTRDFDRNRGERGGGFGDRGGPGGPGGPGGGRDRRDFSRGRPDFRDDRGFGGPPPYRERRPPAPPAETEDFQDVDAGLAIAIINTATKLTEIVGTAGMPEGHAERREAVLENFQAIYFSLLDAITGDEEDEDGEE